MLWCYTSKLCQTQIAYVFFWEFIVLSFTFGFMMHFELIFVKGLCLDSVMFEKICIYVQVRYVSVGFLLVMSLLFTSLVSE